MSAAHAVIVQGAIDLLADPAHRYGILEELVIPELRALPGYRNSLWLTDGATTGTCIVVFDDAEHARAGFEVLTRDGGPPTLAAGIHEVEAEDPTPGP
ncbi:MAG TPA: hypothetical protein VG346_12990 [Acidimicrobiales bacterium]|nr:hypothetical protein [Acidimicrobiales bacterium]